ncbi:MBL fold metallo-hydrolase [Chitinophaga nivalis]|uniref:MBL fold metallo-hydrolase n=1 Tax=Chitinophaga nivalis TaxID=2991709 RepID=A0ABT3ILI9_9BACT|nr:MBL fold metallo-hydrolase [Chitinophaga nivalis]MCW3465695.1 MBL fold metallo-hydrolase [Chitinophaga nivalis]MCW3484614.1 MBL fold metallo-hydrolase [Chitinophaga nivalis]
MLQIHHLNCVDIQSPMGASAIGHCLLLETPDRLVLIDTGIGLQETRQPAERLGQQLIDAIGLQFDEALTAIQQITALGLDPKKVTDCLISHLDLDHIGGLADFPHATVHVGAEEYEQFTRDHDRYLSHQLDHRPEIITYPAGNDTWFSFEARKTRVAIDTDIYLIPLFGHSRGHCGVAIRQEATWLFYIGDAYYLRAELTDPDHPVAALSKMKADDAALHMATLHRIRTFMHAHPEVVVFGYHDITEFPLPAVTRENESPV